MFHESDLSTIDRLGLRVFRAERRWGMARPSIAPHMARAGRREGKGLLTPLAHNHPILAGVLAGGFFGAAFFLPLVALAILRAGSATRVVAILVGVLALLVGAAFGVAMGWYWSFSKRYRLGDAEAFKMTEPEPDRPFQL